MAPSPHAYTSQNNTSQDSPYVGCSAAISPSALHRKDVASARLPRHVAHRRPRGQQTAGQVGGNHLLHLLRRLAQQGLQEGSGRVAGWCEGVGGGGACWMDASLSHTSTMHVGHPFMPQPLCATPQASNSDADLEGSGAAGVVDPDLHATPQRRRSPVHQAIQRSRVTHVALGAWWQKSRGVRGAETLEWAGG